MPGRVSLWARTDDEVRTRGPGRQGGDQALASSFLRVKYGPWFLNPAVKDPGEAGSAPTAHRHR